MHADLRTHRLMAFDQADRRKPRHPRLLRQTHLGSIPHPVPQSSRCLSGSTSLTLPDSDYPQVSGDIFPPLLQDCSEAPHMESKEVLPLVTFNTSRRARQQNSPPRLPKSRPTTAHASDMFLRARSVAPCASGKSTSFHHAIESTSARTVLQPAASVHLSGHQSQREPVAPSA